MVSPTQVEVGSVEVNNLPSSGYVFQASVRRPNRTSEKGLPYRPRSLVPAVSHHLEPLMRDRSQFTWMLFHPCINGGIPLEVPSNRSKPFLAVTSLSALRDRWLPGTATSYSLCTRHRAKQRNTLSGQHRDA